MVDAHEAARVDRHVGRRVPHVRGRTRERAVVEVAAVVETEVVAREERPPSLR